MVKLINLHTFGSLALADHSKGYWHSTKPFGVIQECDDGCRAYVMLPHWVTDKRSGSCLADFVIPKWSGNPKYQAVIACHDMGYSGHSDKATVDELFYQGLLLCGYSKTRAGLAYHAVRKLGDGGYYNLGDVMPKPYTENRKFEIFRHFATFKEAKEFVEMELIFSAQNSIIPN